jgi:pilus assembly protein CpaB
MKFALKLPQFNRNWLMLGGALALGLVATALSYKLLQDRLTQIELDAKNGQKLVAVVVAKVPLPRGTVVQGGAFAKREIPAEFVSSGAISPDQFNDVLGQKLVAPLQGGEALLSVHLELPDQAFSATLENGNRALTTEVDEINSISGMLRPTDRIDLMATAKGSGADTTEVTFPLLSNVEVLATGQVTRPVKEENNNMEGSEGSERTYTTITLSVSPQDAQRIIVAKSTGKLTAVLRNPEDEKTDLLPAMNIDDVLPKKPKAAKQLAVQYIIG